jgi:YHS domain-containing protein
MAEQVNYNDPIEPWAEPQPWQKPARPMVNPSPQPVANVAPPRRESPPGLGGFCPVQLVEGENWVTGEPGWAVEHRGRIYLMSGASQQERFLANPDRYAPVLSGNDPVLAVDQGQREPGLTDHCVVYDGRLYSFSNHSTLARFHQNPKRYSMVAKGASY